MKTQDLAGSRRASARRWVLSLTALLAAGTTWVWLRRSLPMLSGTLTVPGLQGPIDVVRDADAIVHIVATSEADALFGLGFAQGQDRLWQLELSRRAAAGRLSEVFGTETLADDRLLRTLGLRQVAERGVAELEPEVLGQLQSFAAGINAAVAATAVWPLEFLLLGTRPEPWQPADVVSVLKLMGWQLSVQWSRELLRAELLESLRPEQVAELLGGDAQALEASSARLGQLAPALGAMGRLAQSLRASSSAALGSNAWAVPGGRSRSGAPLLANDPHLELTMPAPWYLAHLVAPGLDVIGGTIPGIPGVLSGRNRELAWGLTNHRADTQDWYLEKLDPSQPDHYLTPSGSAPFAVHEELILVKGSRPERLQVRSTRHGPVLSDVSPDARAQLPAGHVLALAYAALLPGDQSVRFPMLMAKARSLPEAREAVRVLASPPQNVLVAERSGAALVVAAGRIPRRPSAAAGGFLVPLPGERADWDWQGFLELEELPSLEAPLTQALVTANQELRSPGATPWLGVDWALPTRSARIEQVLAGRSLHDVQTFGELQQDERSEQARQIVAVALPLLEQAAQRWPAHAGVLTALARWDGVMRASAAEPLLFATWAQVLVQRVFADELAESLASVSHEASERLMALAMRPDSVWCDDTRTTLPETCRWVAEQALGQALGELETRYGADSRGWTWAEAHVAHFRHQPLSEVPLLGRWLDTWVPVGGGNDTVNLAEYWEEPGGGAFEVRCGPNLRVVHDLSDPDLSSGIVAVGQSGNPLSPYYRNWAIAWQRGERVPWRMTLDRARDGSLGTVHLLPDGSAGADVPQQISRPVGAGLPLERPERPRRSDEDESNEDSR